MFLGLRTASYSAKDLAAAVHGVMMREASAVRCTVGN